MRARPWIAAGALLVRGVWGTASSAECALSRASRSGDAVKAAELLAKGADPDCRGTGKPPLVEAVDGRDSRQALAVVKILVERGADVNGRDGFGPSACSKALARWIAKGDDSYKEIAKLLLSRGAKLEDQAPAFKFAMARMAEDIVPLLKPKPALARQWAFRQAFLRGDATNRNRSSLTMIAALLDKGVPVNGADPKSGDTLLHIAVRLRDKDLVRLLKERGADAAARHRKSGLTPLGVAEAESKGRNAKAYLEILEILKTAGPRAGPKAK